MRSETRSAVDDTSSATDRLLQIFSPGKPTISFHTLGCRLNQSESASLGAGFYSAGYQVVDEKNEADLAVINTCSVTEQAEAKCRNLIRKILKQNPKTFIAVTGCYAQVGTDALRKMPGIDLIAGTEFKMDLPKLVEELLDGRPPAKRPTPMVFHTSKIGRNDFTIESYAAFDKATRPNIKIQDGCDFFCSFCIIPTTRGRERSRKQDDILLETSIWVARGHREIVLTGVNLGEYRSEGEDLADLIEALETIDGLHRIRISSIEPTTVSDRILDQMARGGKLCPYLHLPLQSGSDAVLSAMGRRYTRREYIDFVREATARVPNLGLGTDVMVGFPGEGEKEFAETLALIDSLPFSYLHVFPFSKRKGTRVTKMDLAPVPSKVIKERSRMLCDLSRQRRKAFYSGAIGGSVEVLFETRNEAGLFCGLTPNYIRVGVESDRDLSGRLGSVRIEAAADGLAIGKLIEEIR
ncbi:MAG: tRNA (N(6)-L-threonylcarbamoyladenosine(37)-C(2))-methylthiotransferase MtaB [Candidatus Manganitrophus sp. SB1]|nr:tRNA (N(6)-L-threonylcarbamoyladenosine(37)-C(2))-methylthiotransferase MtaB [Candidatus Manganitrophus morganii]